MEGNSKNYLPGPLFGQYSFINISCGKEEIDHDHYSRKNIMEVALVIKILQNLYKAWKAFKQPLSIAIVSSYSSQVDEIREKIGERYKSFDELVVKVTLVQELLQRKEEQDIVILSTVRSKSNSDCTISLPSDRLSVNNVTSIRARLGLWILGNEAILSESDSSWKSLIQEAKDMKCFHYVEEDKDMFEFVVQVKNELDQLDELLTPDSSLFRNSRWKVLFSDDFKKSLERIGSSETKKLVVNLLLRLANGWRPKRRNNVNITCDKSKHTLKQFKVKDRHIICSIDIIKDSHSTYYMQVLSVWDVIPLPEVSLLVKRLDTEFQKYTDGFLDRCKAKCVDGDLEIPKLWDTSHEIVRYRVHDKDSRHNSTPTESSLLMKFYSVSSGTVNHMLSGCNGKEVKLPFELTSQEMKIIHFNRSSFVLGRSGTGKTTILIRKLFQREQLSHIASEGFHEPHGCSENALNNKTFIRQIFVTLNHRLCYAVKEQYSALKRFATGWKASEDYNSVQLDDLEDLSQFGDIPDSFANLEYKLYPLSITFNKFLMMLDGTIGNSFFDRFPQASKIRSHGNSRSSKSLALKTFIRMNQVTFEKFRLSYWPHFDQKLTTSLEASTVFTEIMSHIKGSIHENPGHEDYISVRRSRVSNLSKNKTEQIYRIFLQYEKIKKINGEYDTADLVTDLHRRFRETSYEGDILDFVYVDEVQDLSMSQIALFKYICKNVGDGFFFAGDTAQTIAKGIDFRFEDIRCLFYKQFLKKERGEKGLVSKLFQLNQNFRSHDRILKLAQSVTNLIYHFFPRSIDILDHEIGHIDGETPKILQSSDGKKALALMFSDDGESGKNLVGFGADQVILVRDDEARNEVTSYIGKHSLILTIPECKGLEFQDVLLYNFLSSSPIRNRWKVIYEYNDNKKSDVTFPHFNEAKHRLLCSELKQLYVAITRTKNRLWIFETDDKLCEPMFDYWEKMNSVEFRQIDRTLADGFKVSGSDYQWKSRGIELFNQHKYEAARMCFEKAGEEFLKKWAQAAELRANAYHISNSNSIMAKIDLNKAAKIFIAIGKFENAAQCFYESEEYECAGEIYFRNCGYSKLKEAGECFTRAGFHDRAALSFARGNFFSDCLNSCIQGKLFDEGFNYIEEWKQHLALNSSSERENSRIRAAKQKLSEAAAVHYKKLRDIAMMMRFVKSFHTRDSMKTFLRSVDCLDELLQLEIEWESFQNAASLANQMGRMLQEADLLEKGKYFGEASSAILTHVFHRSVSIEGWPLKPFDGNNELLNRAELLAKKVSNKFFDSVQLEVQILSSRLFSLNHLVTLFDGFQKHSILRGEILSARKILDAHFHMCGDKYLVTDLGRHGKDVLSKNEVSVENLIFFYNFWKSKIKKVFKYLEGLKFYEDYGEFCLNYLGAIKADNSSNKKTKFILLNPDACWAKQINKCHRSHKGDLVLCKAKQFVHAARCYWSYEMVSVGTKVLEKLKSLFELWRQDSLPLHCRVAPLLNMFEVVKSLNESKFLHRKRDDEIRIHTYLKMSSGNFLDDLFPVDWRDRVTLDVIELRKSEKFGTLLKQFVLENWSKKSQTFEIFFKFSVIAAFDSKRLEEEMRGKISTHFRDCQFMRTFLESLINSRATLDTTSLVKNLLISFELLIGEGGFSVSPCFSVYLLEHILISTFFLKGHFFWTSSSFLDWFVGKEKNPNDMVFLECESDWEAHFGSALDSVAMIIYTILSRETYVGVECHKVLLLRLFVAFSLLCLNTGNYYSWLSELLDKEDIVSQLRPEFSNFVEMLKFESSTSDTISKVRVLAKAFGEIGNPMVIVSSGKSSIESDQISNAFFFDLSDLEADGEIFYD